MNISKKEIALIANSAWNINNFRLPLIDRLLDEYTVHVITPDINELQTPKEVQRVPLFYLNDHSTNPKNEVLALKELRIRITEIKPQLCILFTIKPVIYGNMICSNLGISTLSTVTGMGHTFIYKSFKNKILQKAYLHSLKVSTSIVVQNNDDEAFLKEKLKGHQQIYHIPGSGVDAQLFAPAKNRLSNQKFRFLFVGRCIYEKGLLELSKAIDLMKSEGYSFEVFIAGKWEPKDRYLKKKDWQSLTRQDHVTYLGISESIQGEMSHADVVVLPSYREGLSRAILEAMSMELPVITTNVPGCRQLIQNNHNGWVVPARDEVALAEAMIEAMNSSPKERREMGKRSRKDILSKYDSNLIVDQYIELIAQIPMSPE